MSFLEVCGVGIAFRRTEMRSSVFTAATIASLATVPVVTSTSAEAYCRGCWIGAGVAGAVIAGAAIASVCGVAQRSLSGAIKWFERSIGSDLFLRRPMLPTAGALAIKPHCERLARTADLVRQEAERLLMIDAKVLM